MGEHFPAKRTAHIGAILPLSRTLDTWTLTCPQSEAAPGDRDNYIQLTGSVRHTRASRFISTKSLMSIWTFDSLPFLHAGAALQAACSKLDET